MTSDYGVTALKRKVKALTCLNGFGFIYFPLFCNIIGQWVIRIGGTEESLDGQEYCPNLKSGTPFVLGRQE